MTKYRIKIEATIESEDSIEEIYHTIDSELEDKYEYCTLSVEEK